MKAPEQVTLQDLKKALIDIKVKVSSAAVSNVSAAPSVKNDYMTGGAPEPNKNRPKTVLIVDDLGIITYQLDILFKKMGFEVTIANEIYDAIEKYKSQDFGYAVIDLFIPTEREGFILLDEL
ncbi:MAG: response regulator [Ignavibacteriales bacterium]|nr:response regulator [Ignavibacteriales bacterium]